MSLRLARFALLGGIIPALLLGCRSSQKAGHEEARHEVEVALFQGGYGIDFFERAARAYETIKPGVTIKVWGNPRIWEQLRPRFVAGNPPDLTWPGWGMDHWPLVYEGQLMDLNAALDGPPFEGSGTWRETFEPSLLALGAYEGKQYMLPYFFSVHGWWYNRPLFEKHGWKPPRTWSELLSLCERIKAAGIAPITYQGKYPYYAIHGFLLPWAASAGGIKAVDDAQNLVPGAWKSPAMLQAARMIQTLRDRGFFQSGANAMSHTEAQMEFLSGRAAFVPCGTWLHSEMREALPPKEKFEMVYMQPPVLDDGKDPSNICIGIEPWVVPARAKYRDIAIDFFKYLTTPDNARRFIEEKGTLMAVKGTEGAQYPPYLKPAAEAFKKSSAVWSVEYIQWYPRLGTESQNAMAALLSGKATPEEFCERVERVAEEIRRDPRVKRHTVSRAPTGSPS